ncbi:hypothetical protein JQ615_22185 [Bradyrhizobium jicamae]|uniref:Ferredoxin n=1 Tax=Bradyrhizobium jicamae TaxID=280332 RepID=A0ABS5FMU2_9BRAD|nr:hypothetical protein [Bradyrhizobium jicamae]MBR0798105.1 hypothetical protein [Bradyrhizobium jicamae]MBR0934493.1 hypothetical protein [Bradyrhizobium jicamae]
MDCVAYPVGACRLMIVAEHGIGGDCRGICVAAGEDVPASYRVRGT